MSFANPPITAAERGPGATGSTSPLRGRSGGGAEPPPWLLEPDVSASQSFQPLHRVADRAPDGVVAVSLPAPRPSPARGEGGRPRPMPCSAKSQSSGSKVPSPQSRARDRRAEQRALAWRRPPPRGTRASATSVSARCLPARHFAENVQPVADLHFLQVAEMRVELAERVADRRS